MENNVTQMSNNNIPYIKSRGNDAFIVHTNDQKKLKILAEKGYIREVNNVLFVCDNETDLWVVCNADFAWLGIPKFLNKNSNRYWNLLKIKKTFTGTYKATAKVLPNTFELNSDQVNDMILTIQQRNLTFAQVYGYVKTPFNLPDYVLGDDV